MTKTKKKTEPRTREAIGFGIINPYGSFWTDEVFQTPDRAWDYLRKFWKSEGFSEEYRDCRGFVVVPVTVILTETLTAAGKRAEVRPPEVRDGD